MIHLLSKKHKFCHGTVKTKRVAIISTRSTNYRKIATSMFKHDATTFKLSINRIIHKPWGKFSFVRSREITPSFCLGQGVRSGVSSRRGGSFDSQTLSAANDASSGNGEGSSWPEVRHIRTTLLAARTCTCTPLPAHKYVATSTSFLPIYFVPHISMVERIFQIFEKGGGGGER